MSRLVLDPEYPFLGALLEPSERAERALMAFDAATTPSDEELERLRASIREQGQALARVQRQARALAEAALVDAPELFAELGFDSRPRRRSLASETPTSNADA